MKRILYVQYTNPAGYPPLEHSSRILANEGWQVLFLGTGAQGANALEFPPHPNIAVRKLQFCPAGWRQKLHFAGFGLWALGWVLRRRPNWIYASDLLSCPSVLALSFLPGLKVVYHEHDSPEARSQKSEVRSRTSSFQRFVMWSRKKLARRAALCILPNEKRIEHFKEQTGTTRPVLCVWNCPRQEEVATNLKSEGGKFIVFFHGSIVPARLPVTVIDAMAMLPENIVLRVAGYETVGHQGYVKSLQARAQNLGVGSRIEFLGAFPRHQLLDQCREAHIGLAFMPMSSTDVNEQTMTGASNKPFDYLACGLALMVSARPDWEEMFVQPGYGLAGNPNDADSIAAKLRWFLEHPKETCEMVERGQQRILAEWNYETQLAPMLAKLES